MFPNGSSPAASAVATDGEPVAQAGRRAVMSICTSAKGEELSAVIAAAAPAVEAVDLRPINQVSSCCVAAWAGTAGRSISARRR